MNKPTRTWTAHEHEYQAKVNRFFLTALFAHFPLALMVAWWSGTGMLGVGMLALLIPAGPLALYLTARSSLWTSTAIGICTMCMSGLLIHAGRGMIEMHFHVFACLALLSMFGSVRTILGAVVTIALHHLLFWMWLPASVFNYSAHIGIVLLHAAFVIFEAGPTCWVALQLRKANRAHGIVAEELKAVTEQILETAQQVAVSSDKLAQGANRQDASLQQTASASEDISTKANLNSDHARRAADVVEQVTQQAEVASRSVGLLADSMEQIRQSSGRIREINRLIDEIAFQTNMLALNAAVEAARSGEAGLGFTVVADEVRALSHRCKQAAEDTARLVDEAERNTTSSSTQLTTVSSVITQFGHCASEVKALVSSVNLGGQEQAQGVAQIGNALSDMQLLLHETVAVSDANRTAGHQLAERASKLQLLVSQLSQEHS